MSTNQIPAGIPVDWKGARLRHVWTYRDGDKILGHVARFDHAETGRKEVIPFLIFEDKRWMFGAGPEPRPLFGLDRLPGDAGTPVFIVEGERCAAALHALGLPAVTSAGGSSAAHKADWAPLERSRRVVILPDCDPPGETYSEAVAGLLARLPGHREVEIARLPGLPEKGDVVDFLQARCPAWDGFEALNSEEVPGLRDELLDAVSDCAEPMSLPGESLGTATWEKPMPLKGEPPPPWPCRVFPEVVDRFVEELAVSTETPRDLAALAVLAVLATAAQRIADLEPLPGYFEPLALWTVCALESGSRKSSVFSAATRPLGEWEAREAEAMEPEIQRINRERGIGTDRIRYLRGKAAKGNKVELAKLLAEIEELEATMPPLLLAPRVQCQDTTPEALALLLANHAKGLAHLSAEGGLFEIMAGRYSKGPNLDVYLQGHAGDRITVDRIGRDTVRIDDPRLSVGLSIQPDVVSGLAGKEGFRGRGIIARFVFGVPSSNVGLRALKAIPIQAETRAAYHAAVVRLLDAAGECRRVLHFDEAALSAWEEYRRAVEDDMGEGGPLQAAKDFGGKLPGTVARIAAVLALTREPGTNIVEAVDMLAAMDVGRYAQAHFLIAFEMMGADPALEGAQAIARLVQREGWTKVTKREIHRRLKSRFPSSRELDAPLAVLEDRAWLRRETGPLQRIGRPTETFEVNPEVAA